MKFSHNTWNKDCKEKIMSTKPFMTLEEFLLLEDPVDRQYKRSIFKTLSSSTYWVARYKVAKKSYDRYGEEGPPPGTTMVMMEAGHGGMGGVHRLLKGIYERSPVFFEMIRKGYDGKEESSLAIRQFWYVVMAHPDDVPDDLRL